jgi:hypothetical protein
MKNDYRIKSEVTEIYLRKKNGEILTTLIDTEDLDKVMQVPNTWTPGYSPVTQTHYVLTKTSIGVRKRKTTHIHRLLMGVSEYLVIDHINGDTLDNRKSNLRVVTKGQNNQNKTKTYKNNSSGIRGVNWHKKNECWMANVRINGKRIYLGSFNSIVEAEKVVIEYRKENMKYSKEALL